MSLIRFRNNNLNLLQFDRGMIDLVLTPLLGIFHKSKNSKSQKSAQLFVSFCLWRRILPLIEHIDILSIVRNDSYIGKNHDKQARWCLYENDIYSDKKIHKLAVPQRRTVSINASSQPPFNHPHPYFPLSICTAS